MTQFPPTADSLCKDMCRRCVAAGELFVPADCEFTASLGGKTWWAAAFCQNSLSRNKSFRLWRCSRIQGKYYRRAWRSWTKFLPQEPEVWSCFHSLGEEAGEGGKPVCDDRGACWGHCREYHASNNRCSLITVWRREAQYQGWLLSMWTAVPL